MNTSYRFQISHFPNISDKFGISGSFGLIKLKLYEGTSLLHDVEVLDRGADRLMGGRLGVYCDSQEAVVWSALSYRLFQINCNNSSFNYVF